MTMASRHQQEQSERVSASLTLPACHWHPSGCLMRALSYRRYFATLFLASHNPTS